MTVKVSGRRLRSLLALIIVSILAFAQLLGCTDSHSQNTSEPKSRKSHKRITVTSLSLVATIMMLAAIAIARTLYSLPSLPANVGNAFIVDYAPGTSKGMLSSPSTSLQPTLQYILSVSGPTADESTLNATMKISSQDFKSGDDQFVWGILLLGGARLQHVKVNSLLDLYPPSLIHRSGFGWQFWGESLSPNSLYIYNNLDHGKNILGAISITGSPDVPSVVSNAAGFAFSSPYDINPSMQSPYGYWNFMEKDSVRVQSNGSVLVPSYVGEVDPATDNPSTLNWTNYNTSSVSQTYSSIVNDSSDSVSPHGVSAVWRDAGDSDRLQIGNLVIGALIGAAISLAAGAISVTTQK